MAAEHTRPDPGASIRVADIPVDDAWVRKHNENAKEVRRLQLSAALVAVVLLAVIAACVLLSGGAVWSWILAVPLGLFALGSVAMIAYIPRSMGSLGRVYATSELVPAVVAGVRPQGLTILALVDRARDRTRGRLPTLVVRSIEALPLHDARVGERVPCVAVVADRSTRGGDGAWQLVSPMPVAWASGDAEAVRRCAAQIPEGEWDTLRRHARRAEEVEASPSGMLPLD